MVRVKRRYLLLEVIPEDPKYLSHSKLDFRSNDIARSLNEVVEMIHGQYGLASIKSSLNVKRYDENTRICLISCRKGPHTFLMTALPFVRQIKKKECTLRRLHLSGSIRGALKYLKRFYLQQIDDLKLDMKELNSTIESFENSLTKRQKIAEENVEDKM